ncbi:glycosyltransferase [Chitinophagaceae bacterium LB-8]|uniref:Glycosyltransferase n=1 Tax=Paraflavisolibacter caeni TaxID=2982496 RepID=A0A9X2Y077_9BACT|nr:glycosyltransferase [Paraflavisolibacter caeni]MCU7552175.1 glycosyltransferase [Paraflavisolibacter caeni]
MKHITFTVTNDLSFDQRMQRICNSLASNGYRITLVGRKLKSSKPLCQSNYSQKRLYCFFTKGFLFYAEYNIRLFLFLLFQKTDAICAIDLDTILPCLITSKLKNKKRIYDAHELFTELKEVRTRPHIFKIWTLVERISVPHFDYSYTVGQGIANEFNRRYNKHFEIIRNMPLLKSLPKDIQRNEKLLYQGAVNEGRCLEKLIPAMQSLDYKLIVCGSGNFMNQLKELIIKYKVENKIELKGMILPNELFHITQQCALGINLVERGGLNQYLSLANKFFDYIHAGIPQITMNFPEYSFINQQFEIALLIDDVNEETIVTKINGLMTDKVKWKQLHENCLKAREILNWQEEEKRLLSFYNKVFDN